MYQFYFKISVTSNMLHLRVNKTYNLEFVWFLSVPFAPCVLNRTTNGTCFWDRFCKSFIHGGLCIFIENKKQCVVCYLCIKYIGCVEVICQIVVQNLTIDDDRCWPFCAIYFTHPLLVELIIDNNHHQYNIMITVLNEHLNPMRPPSIN